MCQAPHWSSTSCRRVICPGTPAALNNIRDLFETAIQPEDREQLAALFRLATELAEVQNLLDRIEQTPEGKDLSESPTG